MTISFDQVRQMPVTQRLQLVEDIWNTLVDENANIALSQEQTIKLDERRAQLLAQPSIGIPWPSAKQHLIASSDSI